MAENGSDRPFQRVLISATQLLPVQHHSKVLSLSLRTVLVSMKCQNMSLCNYARPSLNQVNNTVPINGDILPRNHLNRFLRHQSAKKGGHSRKICGWGTGAVGKSFVSRHLPNQKNGTYISPTALSNSSGSSTSCPTMF